MVMHHLCMMLVSLMMMMLTHVCVIVHDRDRALQSMHLSRGLGHIGTDIGNDDTQVRATGCDVCCAIRPSRRMPLAHSRRRVVCVRIQDSSGDGEERSLRRHVHTRIPGIILLCHESVVWRN